MIRLIKPYISFQEVEAEFKSIFENGIFTKGPFVARFSDAIRIYTGAKHAFLTTSATTALTMSLKVLGIGPGDEVIVSDFSFPATANVVEDLGARPIFVDVSLETFNMLPEMLEKRISSKTKAVIFVDALGNPSGLEEIKAVCEKHKIPLIEDAACAFGSSSNGKKCGSIADLTCFSFHPRKLLTTGEGGAITTHNDKWAELLKIKLEHGGKPVQGRFDFVDFGFNYRLPDLQCAMGIRQVEKIEAIVAERSLTRDQYVEHLKPLGFKPQEIASNCRSNFQSVVFRVPVGTSRDSLIQHLKKNEIESTLGTYCMSAGSYFKSKYNDVQPNSLKLEETTITFPCYSGVDVEKITKSIQDWKRA